MSHTSLSPLMRWRKLNCGPRPWRFDDSGWSFHACPPTPFFYLCCPWRLEDSLGLCDLGFPVRVCDKLWLVTQEPCWTCGYLGVNTTQSSGGFARDVTQPHIDRNLLQKSTCGGSFGVRRLLATVWDMNSLSLSWLTRRRWAILSTRGVLVRRWFAANSCSPPSCLPRTKPSMSIKAFDAVSLNYPTYDNWLVMTCSAWGWSV